MGEKTADLDSVLERYCEAAETTRIVRRGASLKDWAMYTAATGSALAIAPSADAAVIYSGIQNTMIAATGTSGSTPLPINIDGIGGTDITFRLDWAAGNGGGLGYAVVLNSPGLAFVRNSNGQPLRMAASSTVDSTRSFASIFGRLRDINGGTAPVAGTWPGGYPTSSTGFLGVRFDEDGTSQQHFAWLRLRVRNDAGGLPDKLTVVDWAYESEPLGSIHVGSIPEPSSLFLLAAGAAGVAAFRKRQRAKD